MPIEKRMLGNTGIALSCIGFGAGQVRNLSLPEADRRLAQAVDRGVNYVDVSPVYGNSEEVLGRVLGPRRENIVLSSKTAKRDGAGAAKDLHSSLHLLRTDRLDLYQIHKIDSLDEVEEIFAPSGAMQRLEAAKHSGKVRFLGFSSHRNEVAEELLRRYCFTSVQFPINFVCWHAGLGPPVVASARKRSVGVLALNSIARGRWPDKQKRGYEIWYEPFDEPQVVDLAQRFTLSLGVTSSLPPEDQYLFELCLDLAEDCRPIASHEADRLRTLAAALQPLHSAGVDDP